MQLGTLIDEALGAKRIMLVTTPGRADVASQARAAVDSSGAGRVVATYAEARLHVPIAVVSEACKMFDASQPDCIVAIGGGSSIGLGKALVIDTGIPLVAVPTTYSGSEMTDIWGVTGPDGKRTGRDVRVAPKLVVYDPTLTWTMPEAITGPSGMNAIAHAVEALYSQSATPVSSALAAEGIRRLATSLPALAGRGNAGSEPDSQARSEARAEAFCGAHLCGVALDMTTMGLHHKLCHVVGGLLDLPHALTHAIILPHATAYNAAAAPSAMATIAMSLDAVADRDRDSDSNRVTAPLALWRLNKRLGITRTLADLGMKESDLDRVTAAALETTYPNPTAVTAEGVRAILTRALRGQPPQ
jgi:maleylacetate reductase